MPRLPTVPVKRLNLIVPAPVYEEIRRLAALEAADPYDTPNVSAMARKLLWLGILTLSRVEDNQC